jgi:hypothetical protein
VPLITGISFGALLADKPFDADRLRQDLDERGATVVIPPETNRITQCTRDTDACKWRHLVGNYDSKIKEFRDIASRCDKTDCSHAAPWNLASVLVALS